MGKIIKFTGKGIKKHVAAPHSDKLAEITMKGVPHDVYRTWDDQKGYRYEAVSFSGGEIKRTPIIRSVNGAGDTKWLDEHYEALDRITANTLIIAENMAGYSELEPYVWRLIEKERELDPYMTTAMERDAHRKYIKRNLKYLKERMAEVTEQSAMAQEEHPKKK